MEYLPLVACKWKLIPIGTIESKGQSSSVNRAAGCQGLAHVRLELAFHICRVDVRYLVSGLVTVLLYLQGWSGKKALQVKLGTVKTSE